MRGRLVVFEGGEGVGKSTQLRRLAARLTSAGVAHRVFREPGGTEVGERIRDILLHSSAPLADTTEAVLFAASRAQLVAQEIQPALARGEHVLLDRFLLSSYAYQVFGRGLPYEAVRDANRVATTGLVPDLTILLTLPPADGLRRAHARASRDRIERAELGFHEKVAQAFGAFAEAARAGRYPECGPIESVDAAGAEEDVDARIHAVINARIPELLPAGVRA